MTNRLLIIPARGGSKRIKLKNIKLFKKKPIIYYPIKEAVKSKLFHTIHVTTDNLKIKKVVEKIRKNITFLRPKNLSNDNTPLIKVFNYVVKSYKKKNINFDEIWFLNPCSPLINNKDLKKASLFFKKQMNNSVLSVCKFSPSIDWAFKMKNNNLIPLNKKKQNKKSQLLQEYYFDTGNFGIFSSKIFYENKKIKFSGYELKREKSVDIDTIDDWKLALKLFK